jgi:hypothetical protein
VHNLEIAKQKSVNGPRRTAKDARRYNEFPGLWDSVKLQWVCICSEWRRRTPFRVPRSCSTSANGHELYAGVSSLWQQEVLRGHHDMSHGFLRQGLSALSASVHCDVTHCDTQSVAMLVHSLFGPCQNVLICWTNSRY